MLLGRWIDANDHMHIDNLAVDQKQCPPFCQPFGGGGVPLFVIRPNINNEIKLISSGNMLCVSVGNRQYCILIGNKYWCTAL